MKIKQEPWIIDSKSTFFKFNMSVIWNYRYFFLKLVQRDIVSFYKQTILGPLWFFIQPLFTTIVFSVIFGNMAIASTDGLPKPLFYLSGVICWNYFSECLNKTSTVFRDHMNIFSKVWFPRIIVPYSIISSVFIRFIIQFLLMITILIYYHANGFQIHLRWGTLFVVFTVLLVALQGLGFGLLISSLAVKYRDLHFLTAFGLQLFMYTTTIIYPLSAVPIDLQWIIQINPLTPIIESFRYGILGRGTFDFYSISYSAAITLVLLTTGSILFNKTEKNFIDTI